MDSDRHSRTSGNLLICFSAMKISSKSILSPGRAREPPQISLSTSLSRRLKSSGSIKNGQASPMFPTGNKKRGCAFENPEPSSPKVTCIGQVRVKTKKQGKKIRARSLKRRSSNKSEASFRKSEINLLRQSSNNGGNRSFRQDRNQRWVHLPFTICEALRAFGAELNCFLPCNSSCNKEAKPAERSSESGGSCVFARWLVAVQDNDAGREIELVVGEDEEARTENQSQRRHVFEGLDFKEENEEQVSESRISICVPPKNALLLMRCRSDPVKMAELAKRFCESPKVEEEEEEENKSKSDESLIATVIEEECEEENEESKTDQNLKLENAEEMVEESVSDVEEEKEEEANWILQEEEPIEIDAENEIVEMKLDITEENQQNQEEQAEEDKEHGEDQENLVEETMAIPNSIPIPISNPTHFVNEIVQDAEKLESAIEDESKQPHENEQNQNTEEDEDQSKNGENPTSESLPVETEQVLEEEPETEIELNLEEEEEENRGKSTEEEQAKESTAKTTDQGIRPETQNDDESGQEEDQSTEQVTPAPAPVPERETESSILPDCLLLMMYEPKLSMEVSKETWVCSTDFVRCVPAREKKTAPPPQPPKKRESKPAAAAVQPGRWSCSFPAAAAAAVMIEQKLVRAKGGGYEPFSLTRCKSEPMRSSAKLAPDACFCKDRKLEPHRSANFGVSAAGIGF